MTSSKPCPDCAVAPDRPHQEGCDVERCSVCKMQRLMCDCRGHDPFSSRWTGEWPGLAECRERGWYVRRRPDGNFGGPCSADDPDATEDLNRLAEFHATGLDPYGPQLPR